MKDYASYSSRIPSPGFNKRVTIKTATETTPTRAGKDVSSPERPGSTSTASMSSVPSSAQGLTTADALSLRRDGTEATVSKLRSALDDATGRGATAQSALAKSDAVILELRSSVRALQQDLASIKTDRDMWQQRHDNILQQLRQAQRAASEASSGPGGTGNADQAAEIQKLQSQLMAQNSADAQDAKLGELQVQLDRAHAQILTADMVRKELEDTLEAEQYTWELRVQDQERTIAELQQQTRNRTVASNALATKGLADKIAALERERSELQTCLDEALQELEAVDAELQTNEHEKSKKIGKIGSKDHAELIEPLQHLLRWIIQERSEELDFAESDLPNLHSMSNDPKKLMAQIQEFLEQTFARTSSHFKESKQQLEEMHEQVTAYQAELKTREESNVELRDSLKDAVELLKPLQDAVDTAKNEKVEMSKQIASLEKENQQSSQSQLSERDDKIKLLQEQVTSLQDQVKEQTQLAEARQSLLQSAPSSSKATRSAPPSNNDSSLSKIQKAREELRRKRETEGNLQQLLRDAQSRFHSLHEQNESVAAQNRELQGRLSSAERQLVTAASSADDHDDIRSLDEASIETQLERSQQELIKRNRLIESLRSDLEMARNSAVPDENMQAMKSELESLRQNETKLSSLQSDMKRLQKDMSQKENIERMLNKSLKEALGLLKPLQMHLEDAEQEKAEIAKELRSLRKRFRQLQMTYAGNEEDERSRSTMGGTDLPIELIKVKEELEETVRQLELENSQLHDALEDLSNVDVNASMMSDSSAALLAKRQNDARLHQKMVSLSTILEATQNKLEDAEVEKQGLLDALKQKDREGNDELRRLREKYERAEAEKNHAKQIARTALLKVEELTMANIEQSSMVQEGPLDIELKMPMAS